MKDKKKTKAKAVSWRPASPSGATSFLVLDPDLDHPHGLGTTVHGVERRRVSPKKTDAEHAADAQSTPQRVDEPRSPVGRKARNGTPTDAATPQTNIWAQDRVTNRPRKLDLVIPPATGHTVSPPAAWLPGSPSGATSFLVLDPDSGTTVHGVERRRASPKKAAAAAVPWQAAHPAMAQRPRPMSSGRDAADSRRSPPHAAYAPWSPVDSQARSAPCTDATAPQPRWAPERVPAALSPALSVDAVPRGAGARSPDALQRAAGLGRPTSAAAPPGAAGCGR
jgi:hypothetical protein